MAILRPFSSAVVLTVVIGIWLRMGPGDVARVTKSFFRGVE